MAPPNKVTSTNSKTKVQRTWKVVYAGKMHKSRVDREAGIIYLWVLCGSSDPRPVIQGALKAHVNKNEVLD